MPAQPLIEAAGLDLGYGGGPPAVTGVSFALAAGERLALLGPNGGGKTTILRAILGELRPLAGGLRVSASCGTVPQTERSRLDYPVSALEVATMGSLSRLPWWRRPGRAERDSARRALERVGMGDLADATFGELSGGQRQRAFIAMVLAQDTQYLLLDEPLNNLDMKHSVEMMRLLRRLADEFGKTIVLVVHDINFASCYSDTILAMKDGRLVHQGSPRLIMQQAMLRDVYDIDIRIEDIDGNRIGVYFA